MVLNSAYPNSDRARAIRSDIAQRHQVTCVACNCLELGEADIHDLLKQVLYEFPLKELDLFLPPWVDALPQEHPIKAALYEAIREGADRLRRIRDVDGAVGSMRECEQVSEARVTAIDLGTGLASAVLELPRSLFYETLSQQSGFQIGDDGDLMALLTQLAQVKAKYDKVADALKEGRPEGGGGDRLRHRGALHRLPGAGGAGDRQAGGEVRGPSEGQRPFHPHDKSRY